jgi:hypothetical protein
VIAAELRDWEPGDGLTCSYAKRAPAGLPCGRPVKTAVSVEDGGPRRADRKIRRPLCEHHARGRMADRLTPGVARSQAERAAFERLAHEHWEDFQTYFAEEIDRLMKQPPS